MFIDPKTSPVSIVFAVEYFIIPSLIEYTAFLSCRKIRNFLRENSQLIFEIAGGYVHINSLGRVMTQNLQPNIWKKRGKLKSIIFLIYAIKNITSLQQLEAVVLHEQLNGLEAVASLPAQLQLRQRAQQQVQGDREQLRHHWRSIGVSKLSLKQYRV